jgi:outer membrane protein
MRKMPFIFLIMIITALPGIIKGADTLQVNEAIALALENNFNITLAKNDLNVAGINNSVGAAGMLPRLDLTGSRSLSVNNTRQEYFNGTSKVSNNASTNSTSAGVQMTWTVFDGLNMFIQKNKLNELENLSEIQLRSVIENTVAQVIQTYYEIVAQEALRKVYQEAMHISHERLKFAGARFGLGSGSELAVLQSTVDMNADSANLIKQTAMIENLKSDLNYLLCRDLTLPFNVASGIPIQSNLSYNELYQKTDKANPELMIARNAISLASLTVKELKSLQMPKLNLNSGFRYSLSTSDVDALTYNRNYGYSIGLSLSYNIFNGFTNKHKINAALVNEGKAVIDLKNAKLEMEANLRQVYNDYITNLKLADFETSSLEFARHSFYVAEEKYRIGSLNDVEFRETQAKLVEAQNMLLSALNRCKLAETELLRLSGQLSGDAGNR